jgi:tetratricopeptide (TPR) repeat protein
MTTALSYLFSFFLLILFVSNTCFGQETKSDSLLLLFQDEQLADTVRIKALIDLASGPYGRSSPDSTSSYFRAANSLALEQMSSDSKFNYHYQSARALFRSSHYLESLSTVELAEKLAKSNEDTTAQIRVLALQSHCLRDLSDLSLALEKATDALLLAEKIGNRRFMAVIRASIGLIHGAFGDFEKARESFYPDLELSQAEGDHDGEVTSLTNIGWSYSEEKSYEKSNEFHLKALAIVEENDLGRHEGTVLLNVGNTYFNLNKMDLAKAYITKGISTARKEKERPAIARGAIQMARLYRESKPDSATHYAMEALDLAKELSNLAIVENAAQILYQLHEDKGDYEQAFEMYKLWKITIDSIFSEKNQKALYQNEAKYEYEYEKQKLKDELAYEQGFSVQKIRSQKRFFLLLAAALIVIILFFFIYKSRQVRSEKERSDLIHEMELFKQRVTVQSISMDGVRDELKLNKKRIEKYLGSSLGDSAWKILNVIYEKPTVSNRDIAKEVFLSVEGVSSSLRRMYRSFDVKSENSKNLKVALLTKAIQISLDEQN